MTSTTVDTEYKLNEDKTTFTKVYMIVNSQCGLAFEIGQFGPHLIAVSSLVLKPSFNR